MKATDYRTAAETRAAVYAIRKYTVERLQFPVDGVYTHYVMTWISVDGGETFWHCGESKYFRTQQEAERYAAIITDSRRICEK